ncbi:MAG TPA: M14 family zinc carboxypeptidase, partial [Euzebyales bacterium]|nr:M14 family zinc carboxypeptidase [Euzebyales bacterium]
MTGPRTFDDRNAVAATGAAIDASEHGRLEITATKAEVAAVEALGFEVTPLAQPAPAPDAQAQDFPPSDAGYHDYAEMTAVVNQVVADHPAIARRISIGESYQGRDLMAVKISDNVATDEPEPEVLFNAHQHAREHLTVEMAIHLLHLFTDGYGSNQRITDIVNTRELW